MQAKVYSSSLRISFWSSRDAHKRLSFFLVVITVVVCSHTTIQNNKLQNQHLHFQVKASGFESINWHSLKIVCNACQPFPTEVCISQVVSSKDSVQASPPARLDSVPRTCNTRAQRQSRSLSSVFKLQSIMYIYRSAVDTIEGNTFQTLFHWSSQQTMAFWYTSTTLASKTYTVTKMSQCVPFTGPSSAVVHLCQFLWE